MVTLLARVNGTMMELGVPVYAASGGLGSQVSPRGWRPGPYWKVNACPSSSFPRCVTWGNRPPGAEWRLWPKKTRS